MTDCVDDLEKAPSSTDIDGEKRVKFENSRYKLIKVYHLFFVFVVVSKFIRSKEFFSSLSLSEICFSLVVSVNQVYTMDSWLFFWNSLPGVY